MSRDLNNYLQSKPIQAKPAGVLDRLSKWRRRNSKLSSLLLLSIMLGMILSVLLFNKRINDLIRKGVTLQDNSQYTQAIGYYTRALYLLKWTPFNEHRSKETFKDLGRAWRGKGNFEQAILCFEKAIEIDFGYAAAIGYLADTYLEMGEYVQAIKYYKTAVRISPEDRYNYYNLGEVYTNQELWDEAVQSYYTSIKIAPEDVETLKEIVSVLRKKGLSGDNEAAEYLKGKDFTPAQIESVLKLFSESAE